MCMSAACVYSCSCTHAHVSMRCYYYNYCCCFLHFRPMPRSECSQCIVIMHVHSRELCMHVHARTCIAENYYREMQLAFHTVYWGWWNGWYDGEVFLLTLSWLGFLDVVQVAFSFSTLNINVAVFTALSWMKIIWRWAVILEHPS